MLNYYLSSARDNIIIGNCEFIRIQSRKSERWDIWVNRERVSSLWLDETVTANTVKMYVQPSCRDPLEVESNVTYSIGIDAICHRETSGICFSNSSKRHTIFQSVAEDIKDFMVNLAAAVTNNNNRMEN